MVNIKGNDSYLSYVLNRWLFCFVSNPKISGKSSKWCWNIAFLCGKLFWSKIWRLCNKIMNCELWLESSFCALQGMKSNWMFLSACTLIHTMSVCLRVSRKVVVHTCTIILYFEVVLKGVKVVSHSSHKWSLRNSYY